MSDRRFLVLHGWQSRRPREHWHWWLAGQLRRHGEQVIYPQLPDPETPTLAAWLEVLDAELAQLGDGERVVVAHSMSCQLWLIAASRLAPGQAVDRVLLVAPPDPRVLGQHDVVTDFAIAAPDRDAVLDASGTLRIVVGEGDEWSPDGPPYPDLGVPVDVVAGGAHLNPASGYGPWPSVLAWCLDRTTPVTARALETTR